MLDPFIFSNFAVMFYDTAPHNPETGISVNKDTKLIRKLIDEAYCDPPGKTVHNLKARREKLEMFIRIADEIPGAALIFQRLYEATVLDEDYEKGLNNKIYEMSKTIEDDNNEIERLKAGPDFAEVERQKKELEAKELKMIQEAEVAGKQSTKLIYFTDGKKVEKDVSKNLMCVALFYKEATHVDYKTEEGLKFIINQISIPTGLDVGHIKQNLKRVFGKDFESYTNPQLKPKDIKILEAYLKANRIPMILTSSAVHETA